MWRFATAIRDNNALALKEQLRDIDLLIIDDMQFLQGKIDPERVLPSDQHAARTAPSKLSLPPTGRHRNWNRWNRACVRVSMAAWRLKWARPTTGCGCPS
jgi:hypothetical protein